MKSVRKAFGPLTAVAMACSTSSAMAGGFALIENGASGLGNAYAGAAAVSSDSSTVWFNPAGMLELSGKEFSIAGHVLGVDTTFTDRGSTLSPATGGAPVSGPGRDQPGGATFIPNLFYVHPINDRLALGMGVTAPFGSSTEYDRDWTGRYLTVESGVSVLDFNPSIAYRINDKFSIGGGISLQLMSVTLANAVDSGTTCLGLSGPNIPAPIAIPALDCVNAGLSPGDLANDSYGEITGDSTGVTFNLSALIKPREGTRIGVAYRHSIDHDLDGDADFDLAPAFATVLANNNNPLLQDSKATATANLPAQMAFSIAHQANSKLELLGDITWTGWSSFQELRVNFASAQPDTVSTQKWKDVVRVSAGANYRYSPKWMFRGGIAYDQEPIPSVQRRTPRIPGNDRTWLAFGAGYNINPKMSLDVSFAHLMLDETPIDNTGDAAGSQTVRGVYDSSVNILSAQFNWKFQ